MISLRIHGSVNDLWRSINNGATRYNAVEPHITCNGRIRNEKTMTTSADV